MSLDVYLYGDGSTYFTKNITHNLGSMAAQAGLYKYLWRPDENDIKKASQLIAPLSVGLDALKEDPEKFIKFEPENRWGSYQGLVQFVEEYLAACIANPETSVKVSR